GHNPPIVIRGGDFITRLEGGGPPVGVFADSIYCAGGGQLKSGDVIVAYTDGVVDAVDSTGGEGGGDGLLAPRNARPFRQPDRIVEAAFAAMDEYSCNCQTDDATILVAVVH